MTKELSFKEQFPELKDLEVAIVLKGDTIGYGIILDNIRKHCLSKQRVKEAMDKIDKEELSKWYDRTTADFVIKYLKKEIGL